MKKICFIYYLYYFLKNIGIYVWGQRWKTYAAIDLQTQSQKECKFTVGFIDATVIIRTMTANDDRTCQT